MLVQLATDSDSRVRSMVAMKRKAPGEVLSGLATDPDAAVRGGSAQSRLPGGCALAADRGREPVVRHAALDNAGLITSRPRRRRAKSNASRKPWLRARCLRRVSRAGARIMASRKDDPNVDDSDRTSTNGLRGAFG